MVKYCGYGNSEEKITILTREEFEDKIEMGLIDY